VGSPWRTPAREPLVNGFISGFFFYHRDEVFKKDFVQIGTAQKIVAFNFLDFKQTPVNL
jgi:hypothetical protein